MKKNNQLNDLLSTTSGRRGLSAASPVFFDSYYLGLQTADHRTRCLERIDELEKEAKATNTKRKLLILQPRSHGKSMLAISYCVRKLCMDRNATILFISASSGQAEKRVRLIKQYMDSEKIIEDWGNGADIPSFKGPDSKWTASQIYLQRDGSNIDPSVDAIGTGGKITGAHCDVVVCDDIDDDLTTASPSVRAKTRDWLTGTITPILNQGGILIVVGTRKHHDDVYAHMKVDPTFDVIEEPAIIQWPDKFEYLVEKNANGRETLKGVKVEGQHKVLWPQFRPIEMLLMERRSMGTTIFAREMQNEVLAVEDAIVKPDWLINCQTLTYELGNIPPQLNPDECTFIQCWDLSIESDKKKANSNDSDFTVGYTLARDPKGVIWIIDAYRNRGITQNELLNVIINTYKKWSQWVQCVIVEKNSFGNLYVQQLQQTSLPIKPALMTKNHNLKKGIHKMAILFENGLVRIPIGNEASKNFSEVLVAEATGYPFQKHDDTLASFLHGITELQNKSMEYSIAVGDKIINSKGEVIEETQNEFFLDNLLSQYGFSSSDDEDTSKNNTHSKKEMNDEQMMRIRFGLE
jgi:phage terminase large subunit-like protein